MSSHKRHALQQVNSQWCALTDGMLCGPIQQEEGSGICKGEGKVPGTQRLMIKSAEFKRHVERAGAFHRSLEVCPAFFQGSQRRPSGSNASGTTSEAAWQVPIPAVEGLSAALPLQLSQCLNSTCLSSPLLTVLIEFEANMVLDGPRTSLTAT